MKAQGSMSLTAQKAEAQRGLDKEKAQTTAVLEASRIASQNEQAEAKNDLAETKAIMDMTKDKAEEERLRAEAHRDASEAYRDDREDR